MKFPHLSASIAVLLSAGIPALTLSIHAEAHCPGSITTLTPRIVAGALLVIPVKINGVGPFDFMVDTGSQITVIDPALAAQLNLNIPRHGRTGSHSQLYAGLGC